MTMVEILREKLKLIFARTASQLPADVWRQKLDDFLKEIEAKPTDLIDDVAYQFPAYLRLKKMTSKTVQMAHFEWLIYSRANLDFGHVRLEKGFLSVEPSLELFLLSEAATSLGMSAGVYAIFKDQNAVEVIPLEPQHVQMLEILQEGDRKYRSQQLVEWMAQETAISSAQWQMTLADLIEWGIIQDNA